MTARGLRWALLCAVPALALAQGTAPLGDGARFSLSLGDARPVDLVIVSGKTPSGGAWVDYALSEGGGLGQVRQRFVLEGPTSGAPVRVTEGYIQLPGMAAPERLPQEHLAARDGLSLEGFLLQRASQVRDLRVGEEVVQVGAGSVKAVHFRRTEADRVVDFWVADDAAPVGLVLLKSRGKRPMDTYTVELQALVKNARGMDTAHARPLSPGTAQMLAGAGGRLM